MSWSLNYLKKLQKNIEQYKEKMLYFVNYQNTMGKQPDLLKIGQELDKLIIGYQSFKRLLNTYQNMPYSVDFYMTTKFSRLKLQNYKFEIDNKEHNQLYIIENDNGEIIDNFSLCYSGTSIWKAEEILDQDDSELLIVIDNHGLILGSLEKQYIISLCEQKLFSGITRKKNNQIEEAFDNVPVSIFVLDKDLFIDYANIEAIKNFNEVLPRNYLFKRADVVFSGFLSDSYQNFVNSEFWQYLHETKECSEIEVKLLKHISLMANIKVVRNNLEIGSIVVSFVNIEDLKQRVQALTLTTDELSQALSLFIPYDIEKRLKEIPEYKDIYNYETKKMIVISKMTDGGYWHVVNCLRILSQIDRASNLGNFGIQKGQLVQAILVHDIGKIQPDLNIGDVVDPQVAFEKSKLHAARSANLYKQMDYDRNVMLLVKYHHHRDNELPKSFPKKLLPALSILRMIDGLSAAITRRNASINFELQQNVLIIHEENHERPEYNTEHVLTFPNTCYNGQKKRNNTKSFS